MNAGQLWNDHTFRVLLEDLFKARKDEALGPLRLEAIFRYVEGTQPAPVQEYRTQSVPKDLRKPMQEGGVFPVAILPGKDRAQVSGPTVIPGREPVDGPGGAFELSEPEEGPAGPQTAAQYLAQQLEERKRRDPNESLKKAADIVEAALEKSGDSVLNVRVPRNYVVAGLEAILKERRVAFSSLSCAIQPKQVHLDTKSAAALSGAAGEGSGGWLITVQR